MTRELLDNATFDGTIATGTNETLQVNVSRADEVIVLIDDGTTDNTPATYDMTQRLYVSGLDEYQFYDKVTGETSRSWTDSAFGEEMQFEFNNQSGSDATYRITIESYKEI